MRSWTKVLLAFAAFAMGTVGMSAAQADTRVALVIGNSHYSRADLVLGNAARDATDVAAALKRVGFDVILKTDIGKSEFEGALDEFARKAEQSDIALFYYAGHGIQYKGDNYFLPVDNAPRDNKDVTFKSVKMGEIVEAVSYAKQTKVIILDACRNSVPDHNAAKGRSVTGFGDAAGLAPVSGSAGMIVFYSTEHGHEALDGEAGDVNSPFAASLLKRLPEPGKDIHDLFTEVSNDVHEATHKDQMPEVVTEELTTKVFLNPAETASDVWKRIKNSTDPQVFREFMRNFPDSELADGAQLKLDKFDADKRHQDDEAARKDAEAKAAAAQAAGLDAVRKAAEAKAAAQALADKQKADKEAADRLIAEKLAQQDAARKDAEAKAAAEKVRADQAAAEAARLAKEKADKDAEAKRLADAAAAEKAQAEKEADAQKREAARQAAEAKQREAAAAAEAARQIAAEKEKARLDEEARRKQIDDDHKREIAAACDRDGKALSDLKQAEDTAGIQALRASSLCPAISAAADLASKAVAQIKQQECTADQKFSSSLDHKDRAKLQSALSLMKCKPVIDVVTADIVKLDAAAAAQEKTCADERTQLAAIDLYAQPARASLVALQTRSVCAPIRPEIVDALKAVDDRVRSVQVELSRIGCWSGDPSSRFDDKTIKAVADYLKYRNAPASEAHLTNGFLEELRNQDFKICPSVEPAPAATPAPVANAPQPKATVASAPAAQPAPAPVPAATPKPKRELARPALILPSQSVGDGAGGETKKVVSAVHGGSGEGAAPRAAAPAAAPAAPAYVPSF